MRPRLSHCSRFSTNQRRLLTAFLCLQILDILTTLAGLRHGAQESSFFVARLLRFGPVEGLLLCKAVAVSLAFGAVWFERERLIRVVNFWFVGVVAWNLAIVLRLSNLLS